MCTLGLYLFLNSYFKTKGVLLQHTLDTPLYILLNSYFQTNVELLQHTLVLITEFLFPNKGCVFTTHPLFGNKNSEKKYNLDKYTDPYAVHPPFLSTSVKVHLYFEAPCLN